MFALRTKYDHFTHRTGDTATLEEILFGLSDNAEEAKRIATIAGHMNEGDGFITDSVLLTCEKEED